MKATGVAQVLALYEQWGEDTYDEELSQLDHALQTAALAVDDGAADALVAAALLHDVGHLLALEQGHRTSAEDLRHEHVGAAWLRPLFGVDVTRPITLHVRAKRYLVAVDDEYARCLSTGSIGSLERQGGAMSEDEVQAFAATAGSSDALRLRRWDDLGKIDGLPVSSLDDYAPLLHRLARRG